MSRPGRDGLIRVRLLPGRMGDAEGDDPAAHPVRARRLPEDRLQALVLEGAHLFDAGRFFESHEAWEHAWHGAPEAERDFFQGLIHAAAACLHHERGNAYGYTRQLERLQRRLGRYPSPTRGVDTQGVIAAVEGLPPAGEPASYPRLGLD